jgi:glycosyltransferase involved in cell wall biosynthesis
VSVVIPSYNSAALVTDAVDSALAQTVAPAEVIIVDDGSTDDTRDRLRRFRAPVRYVHQENQGVAAARNRGLSEAGGQFVAFLDADDVWHPRKLEKQLECMECRPELGLLGTGTLEWPRESFATLQRAIPAPAVVGLEELVIRNLFITSSVLVRRPVLERVGHFDTALHGPEDFDLWLRIAQVSAVANLPLPLTGYRNVPGSLGKQAVSMETGMHLILKKLQAAGVFRRRRLLHHKAWSYCHYTCAYMYGVAGEHSTAVRRMLKSLLRYPLPYRRREVRIPLARARLLLRAVRSGVGGAKPKLASPAHSCAETQEAVISQ